MDEVEIFAAFHLEAWTSEDQAALFARAVDTLRAAGIRVKCGYAPGYEQDPEANSAIGEVLYP